MFYQTNCMHAGRRKSRQMTFLSLVILTFDLCLTLTFRLIWTRDQTRFPCESDANPSSGSRDISQTGGAKNRTFRSSPRAVTSDIRACVGFWCFPNKSRPCSALNRFDSSTRRTATSERSCRHRSTPGRRHSVNCTYKDICKYFRTRPV